MVLLPSECRESKVKYPAPWGGKGGEASWIQGLPWGIDTFHWERVTGSGLNHLKPKINGNATTTNAAQTANTVRNRICITTMRWKVPFLKM